MLVNSFMHMGSFLYDKYNNWFIALLLKSAGINETHDYNYQLNSLFHTPKMRLILGYSQILSCTQRERRGGGSRGIMSPSWIDCKQLWAEIWECLGVRLTGTLKEDTLPTVLQNQFSTNVTNLDLFRICRAQALMVMLQWTWASYRLDCPLCPIPL